MARQRRRFGCPRIHLMLRRAGLVINHKRTERLYREEGLSLRKRKRKKTAAMARVVLPAAEPGEDRVVPQGVQHIPIPARRIGRPGSGPGYDRSPRYP